MPSNKNIFYILDYLKNNRGHYTLTQMFYHFKEEDLLKDLIFAFSFMHKGEILVFESLLSKKIVSRTFIERPELLDADIIEEMMNNNRF